MEKKQFLSKKILSKKRHR